MKVFVSTFFLLFVGIQSAGLVSAQVREETDKKPESSSSNQAAVNTPPLISIELVGGGRLQVEELIETRDGIWYKRGGVTTLLDRTRVARIERSSSEKTEQVAAAPQEAPRWSLADSKKVEKFFFTKFGRALPTSAFGQSHIHDRWGLDHRQGMDVGLHPDSVEGIALVNFLRAESIPFLVFRHAIPGVATGPHIHIGRPSHRIRRRS